MKKSLDKRIEDLFREFEFTHIGLPTRAARFYSKFISEKAFPIIFELKEQLRPGSPTERAPTQDAYDAACKALHKHKAENKQLREALEFYGNEDNYEIKNTGDILSHAGWMFVSDNLGNKARKSLKVAE